MSEPESPAQCSYEGCPRPVHGDTDKCIFHAPADKKDPQEFRNALACQIREWRNEKVTAWDFRGCVFVDVERIVCPRRSWEKHNMFRRAVFPAFVSFSGAKFESEACFSSSKFTGFAGFEYAQFTGYAFFESAQFMEMAVFRSVQFMDLARFRSARFRGDVYWGSAQFKGNVDFEFARFKTGANFASVQFTGDADFHFVQFRRRTVFQNVKFFRQSVFVGASFQGKLDLTHASFAHHGDFKEGSILGHVRLLWPGEGKTRIQPAKGEEDKSLTASAEIQRGKLLLKNLQFSPTGVLDLRRNSLAPDCELAIEDCDMTRVLLEGTDCTKIRFYNCTWPVALGRQMVGDEWRGRPYLKRSFLRRARLVLRICRGKRLGLLRKLAKPHADWSLVALTYQQLARRFHEDFNHSVANDFDRGVFEMKRLTNRRFLSRWLGLAAWYRYLSNYGGSVLRPVFALVASLGLFALGYAGTTRPNIHENCAWTGWDYLGLSLQVSYLNRAGLEFARGNSIGVNVLMALQVVFTATLVALFVFAIRRRFRHG
ncbi:MAG: pentapeptide repeat-containing protein [bacterium]|nr:pentapeptide repeat-containing protein [bacterium]